MVWRKMQHHDEGHARRISHPFQQLDQGFQPARRSANSHHREVERTPDNRVSETGALRR
jgi:hypothetical protein